MKTKKLHSAISPVPAGASFTNRPLSLCDLPRLVQAAHRSFMSLVGLRSLTDFEATLRTLPSAPALGNWLYPHRSLPGLFCAALDALVDAADEAVELRNGKTLLATGAPVAFRQDVIVRYLRDCYSEDGATFFALLFTIGTKAEVVVWVEDDMHRNRIAYRGDALAVQRAGMEANLFRGRCFAGTTKPQVPHKHFLRLR